MKLSFLTLSALAFMVAASPAYIRSQGAPPSAAIGDSNSRTPAEIGVRAELHLGALQSQDQVGQRDSENAVDQAGDKLISVIIGNERQNVGTLTGPSLYHEVYQALQGLCNTEANAGRCNSAGERRIRIRYFVPPITFKWEDLVVTVKDSYFGTHAALRDLMIGTVAAVVQRSSEDQKNCSTSAKKHCNIGDTVKVMASERDLLEVVLHSSQRTGRFDCAAIVEATDRDVQTLLPLYTKALGGGHTVRNVWCTSTAITKE